MNKFFKENKTFLAIVIGALIVGGAIYFSLGKTENGDVDGEENCTEIPELYPFLKFDIKT